MTRKTLLILGLALCSLTLSTEVRAEGPTTVSYPYGKDWQGVRYGPHRPWWSAGLTVGYKPSRITIGSERRSQFLIGAEGRYHLSSRLALVLAGHFSGHRVGDSSEIGDVDYSTSFRYSERAWQVGVDFGLWETKMAHFQVGPRLGIQAMKAEFALDEDGLTPFLEDTPSLEDQIGTFEVKAMDPFVGATARLGVFAARLVEFGIHAHYEMIYGLQRPSVGYTNGMDFGLELGGYSVVHF